MIINFIGIRVEVLSCKVTLFCTYIMRSQQTTVLPKMLCLKGNKELLFANSIELASVSSKLHVYRHIHSAKWFRSNKNGTSPGVLINLHPLRTSGAGGSRMSALTGHCEKNAHTRMEF